MDKNYYSVKIYVACTRPTPDSDNYCISEGFLRKEDADDYAALIPNGFVIKVVAKKFFR